MMSVNQTLPDDEFVWPFSMPNILPDENDIPLIKVDDQSEIRYRENLAGKYGRKKQMISGVHFNFSFTLNFLKKSASMFKTMTSWMSGATICI
ncbi:MAG: hypothetical protein U5K84_01280 [Alkalibacterium sp.]|nr:hypothetical protein [Alkalibacterium sp.]